MTQLNILMKVISLRRQIIRTQAPDFLSDASRTTPLWKNADPGVAEVEDARERVAALKNQ